MATKQNDNNAFTAAAVAAGVAVLCVTAGYAQLSTQVNTLTGNLHTRIVWLEGGDQQWGGGALKGFDSQTGLVSTLRSATYRQTRPLICSNGSRVVYTVNGQIEVVNWDGSGRRVVKTGLASDVWVEPGSGIEWVIYRTGSMDTDGRYYRCQLDNPTAPVVELCGRGGGFDQTAWWQVSADGTFGREFLPWPWANAMRNAALEKVEGASRIQLLLLDGVTQAQGCWSSCAPDNSYYSFHFNKTSAEAAHSALYVYQDINPVANVTITAGPLQSGTRTNEFYHPKFASKGGRFVTLTGGYLHSSDYSRVEVYFGKFSANYRAFDGWVRITNNSVGDFYPDAWVEVGAAGASIQFSPSSLSFSAVQGGPNPAAQNVAATTPSGTLSNVSASNDAAWLQSTVSGSGASWTVANNVNISGLGSGTHTAQVTVSATGVSSNSYGVSLTIGTPLASSIVITPSEAAVALGQQLQFSAEVLDQAGTPLAQQPALSWTLTDAPGGSGITAGGLFSAGNVAGVCRVVAASGALRDTAQVSVYRPISITYPAGGEAFSIGQTITIQWSAVATVPGVVIEVSPDNGESWFVISSGHIVPDSPEWGAYPWSIPMTVGAGVSMHSDAVRFRIYDYANPALNDITPAPITVPVHRIVDGAESPRLRVWVRQGLRVCVPWQGTHQVALYSLAGTLMSSRRGEGPAQYHFERLRGVVMVKTTVGGHTYIHQGMQIDTR